MNRKQRRASNAIPADDLTRLVGSANRLLQQGAVRPAEIALRKALALAPAHPDLLMQLGLVEHRLGKTASALGHIGQSMAMQPQPQTGLILARFLAADGQGGKAAEACDTVIALTPGDVAVLLDATAILIGLADYDRAEIALRRILELQPGRFDALANLGSVLFAQGRFDRAVRMFTAALHQQSRHAMTHKNLAAAQRALGNFTDALQSYRTAIAMQPDLAEAHRDLGLLLLLLGAFDEGFAEYEWRWRAGTVGAPPLPGQRWRGDALTGRTILLYFEQGFGDTLQFLRYVPMVAARGAHVTICVQPALAALAASVSGVAQTVSACSPLPHYDVYTNLLSLPHLFGTTGQTIPAPGPYLKVPPSRQAHWRDLLPPGPVPKIGLVWAGNAEHENDARRSIDKALLAPLTLGTKAAYYSLRPGEAVPAPIIDLGPLLTDFAETGAALEKLDLLITVDTAVAHLAGALGRPVWLLLPFVPDWRWLLERPDSPWYPTMRLFRQPRPGDWPAVIAAVTEALADFR